MFTAQSYVRPSSLEEAWQLNQKKRNRLLGGMLWMKLGNPSLQTVIDLHDVLSDEIIETEDMFSIGAMASLRSMELHPGLYAYSRGALRNALKDIVGVQFRNMATVGGSLWGRFGFSDVLTVLLSMDCSVELYKGGVVSLEEFAAMKKDNDILVRLLIRKTPGQFVYRAMRAQRTDFPILTCALSCMNGQYKAVIGARPGRALVLRDDQHLLTDRISEECAAAFADYTAKTVPTGSNLRGSREYRTHLVRVLTLRNLREMKGDLLWN